MAAKDAYVLCQSFEKLHTSKFTGTRAPDLEYRFGLLKTTPPDNSFADAEEYTLSGTDACRHVHSLRENGQLEITTTSLANYTLTSPDIVSKMAHKTIVVLGCDHPLSPTKALLRIPGVTVLGIPSSLKGLESVREFATFNAPDDTSFVYPTHADSDNLILSRGPHVAQWILDNTKDSDSVENENAHHDSELVLVPMPLPLAEDYFAPTESAVRWAASSDLIVERVLRARSDSTRCSVWSYQSSTTCMVVPAASTTKSTERLLQRPGHEPWLHTLSLGTILTPTVGEKSTSASTPLASKEDDSASALDSDAQKSASESTKRMSDLDSTTHHDYAIVNGILTVEGPHHILAEHIRQWRALVTSYPDDYQHYDDSDDDDDSVDLSKDVHVFCPHVPLITEDLVSSENAHLLDPVRVFDAGAAASLLAAISLAGLVDPIVNRPMPTLDTRVGNRSGNFCSETTPFAMFWNGSVHGGIWNAPYTLDSVSGTTGYVLGKVYEYYHFYNGATDTATPEETSISTPSSSSQPVDVISLHALRTGYGTGTATIEMEMATQNHKSSAMVDVVPSTTEGEEEEDLPDIVQERLEMYV